MSIFEYDAEKHMRLEKEESYEDGLAEGHRVGKAEALLIILSEKGNLSEVVKERILEEKDDAVLNGWLTLAVTSECIENFVKEM